MGAFLELSNYQAPTWANRLSKIPRTKYSLGMLPTPIHRWNVPGLPDGLNMWIKRDDMSGMAMSGNKVRKLEFLMAEAKEQGHDCVVTIGGIQSNHCRATAVAARYLGLGCHLILRCSRDQAEKDPGLVGNLLIDRLSGAIIHKVTKEEYMRVGSVGLLTMLEDQLKAQGLNPYLIPVGGSSALGTWGYLQCAEEIKQQTQSMGITDIVMASGSGGTAAGLALGNHLSGLHTTLHAYGVCDDPTYFYNYIDELLLGLGATPEVLGGSTARELLFAKQARGMGYALSTRDELSVVKAVAQATGVLLDPVYSGKALYCFLQEVQQKPEKWAGRNVLFIHTGGLLGMYDKSDQLQPLFQDSGDSMRMDVKL